MWWNMGGSCCGLLSGNIPKQYHLNVSQVHYCCAIPHYDKLVYKLLHVYSSNLCVYRCADDLKCIAV
jgi:hypothetical protein